MTGPSPLTGDQREARRFASAQRDRPTRACAVYRPCDIAAVVLVVPRRASSSYPIASEVASFPQALHRIAYVISLMLHGRRDYNPHSRARHPAV